MREKHAVYTFCYQNLFIGEEFAVLFCKIKLSFALLNTQKIVQVKLQSLIVLEIRFQPINSPN
jgi:hypothetical protein